MRSNDEQNGYWCGMSEGTWPLKQQNQYPWSCYHVENLILVSSHNIQREYELNLLIYLLTYSMEQSPSWDANWFSVSQIPCIVWNLKVHYYIHKHSSPIPILSQLDPVYAPTSYFLKIHLNVILPSMPGSPKWSLSFRFPHQNPVYASPLPHTCHMPRPSHPSWFDHPKKIWWGVWKQTYVRKFNPTIHSNTWFNGCAERIIVLSPPDQSHNNTSNIPTIWKSHKPPLVILSPKLQFQIVYQSSNNKYTHLSFFCTCQFWRIRICGVST